MKDKVLTFTISFKKEHSFATDCSDRFTQSSIVLQKLHDVGVVEEEIVAHQKTLAGGKKNKKQGSRRLS